MRLFVSGDTIISRRAILNLNNFLNKYLKGRFKIKVIDVLENPEAVISEEIITMPFLIKDLPLPKSRITGDMSDENKLLREFLIL
jgi:circadian clock protein KaiB